MPVDASMSSGLGYGAGGGNDDDVRDLWRGRFALARPGHEAHFERAIDDVLANPYGGYANEIRDTAARRAVDAAKPLPSFRKIALAFDAGRGNVCSAHHLAGVCGAHDNDYGRRSTDHGAGDIVRLIGSAERVGHRGVGSRRLMRDARRLDNARLYLQRRTRDFQRQLGVLLRGNGVPR